ncbi:hypothetical protein H5410_037606 [Solanum commersonii]|uniref:Uncharacterized protein n=1 Tax=Solanum commersonii TaxID=4109 RepID=A0A9J5YBM8_SOLCO|nr:hypothetical protein H5410_037606 [Solanum commersonii]
MLSEICQSPKEKSRESQVETKESHEIKKGLRDILTDLAEEYHNENFMEETLERCITESNNEEARERESYPKDIENELVREKQISTPELKVLPTHLNVPQQTRSLPRRVIAQNQAQTRDQRASFRERVVSPRDRVGRFFNRMISARASHQDTQSYGESTIKKKIGEKEPPPLKSYDATKFVSWEAQQRFKVKSFKKSIVEKGVEQGSLIGDYQQPEEANMTIVMEFYANLPEHEYHVCMVRGKTVNFA